MSARLASWLMFGASLSLTALGFLFLIMNFYHPNGYVFDYWAENAVIAVSGSTVGALISSRRPDSSIGWLFCAVGLLGAARHFGSEYASYALLAVPGSLPGGETVAWLTYWTQAPLYGLFAYLGLLFPDGRLPGRRWRIFAWFGAFVILAGAISVAFSPGPVDGLGPVQNPLGIPGANDLFAPVRMLLNFLILVAAISLFVRLHRANGVERQQLKWIAYAAAVAVSGAILKYVVSPMMGGAPVWWAGSFLVLAGLAGIPITVGIAILRYRLWDIDVIINRTLVYGALSGFLILIYLGGIVLLQRAFLFLTGAGSQLAVVASTLAIAALFQPLRRWIQEFIDRRFYRKSYNVMRTLEAFSAKLRDETDLERLNDDLIAVVRETIQPEHASLWLRPREDRTGR